MLKMPVSRLDLKAPAAQASAQLGMSTGITGHRADLRNRSDEN